MRFSLNDLAFALAILSSLFVSTAAIAENPSFEAFVKKLPAPTNALDRKNGFRDLKFGAHVSSVSGLVPATPPGWMGRPDNMCVGEWYSRPSDKLPCPARHQRSRMCAEGLLKSTHGLVPEGRRGSNGQNSFAVEEMGPSLAMSG